MLTTWDLHGLQIYAQQGKRICGSRSGELKPTTGARVVVAANGYEFEVG